MSVPRINRVSGISMTEYSVEGSLQGVLDMIRWIFDTYHPAAYGTRVHSIEHQANDDYAARVSRANSAD